MGSKRPGKKNSGIEQEPTSQPADHGPSVATPSSTYGVEELGGQAQVVVQSQEGDPLQPHHDDLGQQEPPGREPRGPRGPKTPQV